MSAPPQTAIHAPSTNGAMMIPSSRKYATPCRARTATPTGNTSARGCIQAGRKSGGRLPPLVLLPRITSTTEARPAPARPNSRTNVVDAPATAMAISPIKPANPTKRPRRRAERLGDDRDQHPTGDAEECNAQKALA